MKKIVSLAIMLLPALTGWGILPSEAVFHNEASDTTRISNLLAEAAKLNSSQERTAWLAEQFIGTPYAAGTLEMTPESLVVNIDEFDCTTFAETVLAMAYTATEGRTSWRDFVYNLERLRYRGGNLNGYSSRLHYFSDWVIDNVHRGNIKDVSDRMPVNDWMIKSLDYMTEHRYLYPALKDSAEYSRMKNCEIGFRNHRFPYVKASRLGSKDMISAIKDGDLVALTTKTPGLDVTHLGFIKKINGELHLLHASSKKGNVILDDMKLQEYIRRTGATGIRIIRLAE